MEPNNAGPDPLRSGSVPDGGTNANLNTTPPSPVSVQATFTPVVITPSAGGPPSPQPQAANPISPQPNFDAVNNLNNLPDTSYLSGVEPVAVPVTASNLTAASMPDNQVPGQPSTVAQQFFASDPGQPGPTLGGKPPRKKLLLGGSVALALVLAGLGYLFAFYIPNKPANVFQTGFSRSGENLTKLVNKITEKSNLERLQNSEIVATAEAKAADFTFNGTFGAKLTKSKSDSSLDVRLTSGSEPERALNIKFLSDLPEDKKYPNLYFQVNGLKALGLDSFVSDLLAYDGKWIAVESDYLESISSPADAPKNRENVTPEETADLMRTISATSNEYLLTSDKNKAVLDNKGFVGKETTDGIKTYRYQVSVNKPHAKDYCRVLSERVISHIVYKKLANLDDAGVEEQKKDISKGCDSTVERSIKDGETMDLWIDAKYKLIHKLRVYDEKNKTTYTDIGQIYKGGDKISFFIAYHQESNKTDVKFTVDVDTKAYTSKGTFTWNQKTREEIDVKVTFEAKPYDGEIKVEKPAGAISIQEVMNTFGYSPPEPSNPTSSGSSSSIQSKAKDTERQTDIKALHGQLEAYYAQNGFYPTLANVNSSSWRATNMRGLDSEALRDPDGSASTLITQATAKQYGYATTGCVASECQGYTLRAVLSTGSTYEKTSLN